MVQIDLSLTMDDQSLLSSICNRLELSFHEIYNREETIFEDDKLIKLDLSNCRLTVLKEGIFDELTNLQTLDLSHNKFSILPEGIFNGLQNLEELTIVGNSNLIFPDDIFSSIKLKYLKIEGIFQENLLSEQKMLATLDIRSKENLPISIFNKLISLRFLSISTKMPLTADHLSDLNLRYLIIMGQRNRSPQIGLFDKIDSLFELQLINNNFTNLPEGFFNKLNDLRYLSLSGNKLKRLPQGIFDTLQNLEELDLSNNHLTALMEDLLDNLSSLYHLDISNNRLTQLNYRNLTIDF